MQYIQYNTEYTWIYIERVAVGGGFLNIPLGASFCMFLTIASIELQASACSLASIVESYGQNTLPIQN